jgi:hypothetical protein
MKETTTSLNITSQNTMKETTTSLNITSQNTMKDTGCGLFHCVLGGYVERLWPLSLCFGRLC